MFFDVRTVELHGDVVRLLDQNALPWECRYVECRSVEEVAEAIKNMTVRGAPAIGVAAAMGIALAVVRSKANELGELRRSVEEAAKLLSSSRPTARNLFWAVERMLAVIRGAETVEEARSLAVKEALKMAEEDVEANRRMGEIGAQLIDEGDVVLTHCKQLGL